MQNCRDRDIVLGRALASTMTQCINQESGHKPLSAPGTKLGHIAKADRRFEVNDKVESTGRLNNWLES
jgi:hypothetical protein